MLLICRPNKRREFKNKKFGFGGQKKRSKMNTAGSSGDMSEFDPNVHQRRPGKKIVNKGNKVRYFLNNDATKHVTTNSLSFISCKKLHPNSESRVDGVLVFYSPVKILMVEETGMSRKKWNHLYFSYTMICMGFEPRQW